MSLRIQERFVSLQGEGLLAGTPSSFIRVSGCNLRCGWCDSPASSWRPQGQRVAIADLVGACETGPRHVVVTGGEPLLFPQTADLTAALQDAGHHVTVETAGTVWLDGLRCDLLSLSPKLRHSTPVDLPWAARHEARRWQPDIVRRLMDTQHWQLKFVVRAYDTAALARDTSEVQRMVTELGVRPRDLGRVLLMPECTDPRRLDTDYAALVPTLRRTGFRLGQRLHISIFGHTPAT